MQAGLLGIVVLAPLYLRCLRSATPGGGHPARDKIAGRMLLLDETLAEGLPLMFDVLGVPDPERSTPPSEPEARQRRLFDLIRRLARARSAREPAVVRSSKTCIGLIERRGRREPRR